MTDSGVLKYGDHELELPVVKATQGNDGLDISKLLATTKAKKPITIGVKGSNATAKLVRSDGKSATIEASRLTISWASDTTATVAGAAGSYRYGNLQVMLLVGIILGAGLGSVSTFMQRLLTPHRPMLPATVNIHEILERVRSLLKAEFPQTLTVCRDYDTSLPDLVGDREQLIQAILNIARNAAQAIKAQSSSSPVAGQITLRTRVARQVTLAKKRHRLALEVQVIDNGPGIPDDIRERMFYPLVSGREGGSGLGLTLAQSFVQQHQGMIECESRPGYTCFSIRMPLGGA